LVPPLEGQKVKFQSARLALEDVPKDGISVVFSAFSAGSDETAQWIAFALPKVVAHVPHLTQDSHLR
jgi:hypothetical protein